MRVAASLLSLNSSVCQYLRREHTHEGGELNFQDYQGQSFVYVN